MSALVGILNITDDSFSDGGLYNNPDTAVIQARKMVDEGASVIDIGAESTRPGAKSIHHEEEWKKLLPMLEAIRSSELNAWISVDTRNPETALKAILLGVDWINDVSGFSSKKMIEAVKDNAVTIVVMHSLGIPANPDVTIPENENVVKTVYQWAENKISELESHGIKKDRIIIDPGIGFGKTAEQSLRLIKNITEFIKLGVKILVGHSRKSFLKLFTDKPANERDHETCRITSYLAYHNVDYIRVHNVIENSKAKEKPRANI